MINFQPASAPVPQGYLPDTGSAYADRGNGLSYGWNAANAWSRDRDVNTDQRYDTLMLTQLYGNRSWEIAVPNGTYLVRASAGDPGYTDSKYIFDVEGKTFLSGTPTANQRFIEGSASVAVTDGRLTLTNGAGASNNKINFIEIAQIDVTEKLSPVYLSDLTPVSATSGWGAYEKDTSNGENPAGDGRVLTIGGTTYAKGLGVHADSRLVYDLNGEYRKFKATVGLDDETGSQGSVVFQVIADGTKIFDSGTMTGTDPGKVVDVEVTGVRQLELIVTTAGDNNHYDHADWADARLVKDEVPPTPTDAYLSDLQEKSATNGWGPFEKDASNGENVAGDGRTLNIAGKTYAKGLGVHADSSIVYQVDGTYQSFKAEIGIDDETAGRGSVIFQVLGDGKKLYDSGTMTAASGRKAVDISIAGVLQLTLVVTSAGDNIHYDHAVWGDARVTQSAPAPAPTPTAPAAASNLAASALSQTQVKLTWTDKSGNETGFRIERATGGGSFTQIASVGANVATYTDASAAANTTYQYRVVAYNTVGNAPASNTASVTTPAAQPAPTAPAAASNLAASALSQTQVKLTWTDKSSNETGFRIERATGGGSFTQIATVGANVATYTDASAAANTTYQYRVVAYNTVGNAPASNTVSATTPAALPTPGITANYVVSTTGSDSGSGTAASPFRTVSKAMSVAQPGQTILIKNGTYKERLSLSRSGSAGKPITLIGESTAGVVFDGTGMADVLVANGARYITIANITIRGAANMAQNYQAAVRTGDNWTLRDMVVEQVDGTAICARGANVVIERVIAQDNGVAGIGADGASNLLVKDSIVRRNNTGKSNPAWKNITSIGGYPTATQVNGLWYMSPDFEAGGGKYWLVNGVTIDGLQAYENVGPGIWFDYNSTNVVIKNSKAYKNRGLPGKDYQGNGIRLELQNQGPFLVENNLMYDNTGQNLSLEQIRNVTVRNNTFVNGGLLFRDYDRGAEYAVYNISITGNKFKNGFIETWEGTWNTSSGSAKKITIDGNSYDSSVLFRWAGRDYTTISSVRSTLGFEANGTTGPITVIY